MASPVRYLAKMLLPELVRMMRTATDVITELRSMGLSYRRTNMLQDIRVLMGSSDRALGLEKLSPWESIPEKLMVRVRLENRSEYRVIGTVKMYDPVSKDYMVKKASYYVSSLDNLLSLEEEIEELEERERHYRGLRFDSFATEAVWHNIS